MYIQPAHMRHIEKQPPARRTVLHSTLSTALCKTICTWTGKLSMCTSWNRYSIELVMLCVRNKSLRQRFLGSRPGFLRMVALQVPDTLCVQWEWEEHTLYAMGLSPVARISRKCDSQPVWFGLASKSQREYRPLQRVTWLHWKHFVVCHIKQSAI